MVAACKTKAPTKKCEPRPIPLDNGPTGRETALVDAMDWPRVARHNWRWMASASTAYAYTSIAGQTVLMHRFILPAPPEVQIDHRNGNGLDNRRSNLRHATPSQNQANRTKRAGTSSRWKGVSFRPADGRWVAHLRYLGRLKFLGAFDKELAAAMAYDREARKRFGRFARLNFPRAGEQPAIL